MKTKQSTGSLLCGALIKAISVIDKLPPQQQERSNRNDMFRLLQALLQNKYPGEKDTVTGRDNYIASQALAYAIAVEHPDKEAMKVLLEDLSGSLEWYEFLMAGADHHIHGWGFPQPTKH